MGRTVACEPVFPAAKAGADVRSGAEKAFRVDLRGLPADLLWSSAAGVLGWRVPICSRCGAAVGGSVVAYPRPGFGGG